MIQLDSTICWKRQQQSARSTAAAVAECARLAEAVQSSTASSADNHQPLTMQQLNNNGSVRRQDDHTLYTDASPHYHYHCQQWLSISILEANVTNMTRMSLITHYKTVHFDQHTHTHSRLTALFPGLSGWASTKKVNQSGFHWSKRQWVAVASAGPQVCTSLHTDNHASTPPLSFFTGRMPFLPPNQQRQSTEGNLYQHTHTHTHFDQHKSIYQ